MKKFFCDFGDGLSVACTAPEEKPAKGAMYDRNIIWSRQPTREIIPKYIAWMNTVNQQLSDDWDYSILCAFNISDTERQIWVYYPGKEPRLCKPEDPDYPLKPQ